MNLYFDVGNTKIKVLYEINNKENIIQFDNSKQGIKDLFKELKTLKGVRNIFISSVTSSQNKLLFKKCKSNFKIKPVFLKYPFKTKLKVIAEQEIGSDLVALAAYASSVSNEAIIVNCGTTITITYVKDNVIKGALILQGFTSSKNNLIKSVEGLKEIKIKHYSKNIGKNTIEAISIGMIDGTIGAIETLCKNISPKAKRIISGGDAIYFKSKLKNFIFVDNATLYGIKILSKELNEN